MKERIKEYLADGIKPAQVCTLVGCSPAYISQLLSNADFKAEVETAMLHNTKPQDEILSSRYTSVEASILSAMQSQVDGADLPQLSKALDSITRAQESKAKIRNPALAGGQTIQTVVQINLPMHALPAPQAQLNDKGEVIAIDNKLLAPMSANGVKNLFSQIKERREVNEFAEHSTPQNSIRETASVPAEHSH